ncbi:hypothetical protein Plhal304r1_c042g0121091 [Plasmopara halstedii]
MHAKYLTVNSTGGLLLGWAFAFSPTIVHTTIAQNFLSAAKKTVFFMPDCSISSWCQLFHQSGLVL